MKLPLALGSAVIPGSESRRTHDRILLSQIEDLQPGRLGPRIYIPYEENGQLSPRYCVPFSSPPMTQKPRLRYMNPPSCRAGRQSKSKLHYDRRSSTSLSWCRAPIWGPRTNVHYAHTVVDLLMWSVLCDETSGLSFTSAAVPRQRSRIYGPLILSYILLRVLIQFL
jgi:hypothetical protein